MRPTTSSAHTRERYSPAAGRANVWEWASASHGGGPPKQALAPGSQALPPSSTSSVTVYECTGAHAEQKAATGAMAALSIAKAHRHPKFAPTDPP